MVGQQQPGWRFVGVELPDEGGKNVCDAKLSIMGRKIGAVAPVLPAAKEEYLDRSLATLLMGGDHVRIQDAVDIDILMGLDLGQCPNAVAHQGSRLVVERLCGLGHPRDQPLVDFIASAGQEVASLLDEECIVELVDAPD